EFGQLRAVDQPVLTGRKDVSEPAGVVCAVRLGRHCGTSRSHRQRQAGHAERGREQAHTSGPCESASGAASRTIPAGPCPRRISIQKRNPHPEPPHGCTGTDLRGPLIPQALHAQGEKPEIIRKPRLSDAPAVEIASCSDRSDVIGWPRVSSRGTARGTGITRRDLVRAGAAAGALASVETLAAPAKVLEKVLAAPSACGALSNI